jgi:hypothetical protein
VESIKRQEEALLKLEQGRAAEQKALSDREAALAALKRQLAEDYRKKQSELEDLKQQLAEEISKLLK